MSGTNAATTVKIFWCRIDSEFETFIATKIYYCKNHKIIILYHNMKHDTYQKVIRKKSISFRIMSFQISVRTELI